MGNGDCISWQVIAEAGGNQRCSFGVVDRLLIILATKNRCQRLDQLSTYCVYQTAPVANDRATDSKSGNAGDTSSYRLTTNVGSLPLPSGARTVRSPFVFCQPIKYTHVLHSTRKRGQCTGSAVLTRPMSQLPMRTCCIIGALSAVLNESIARILRSISYI